jgi:hypothetical protein
VDDAADNRANKWKSGASLQQNGEAPQPEPPFRQTTPATPTARLAHRLHPIDAREMTGLRTSGLHRGRPSLFNNVAGAEMGDVASERAASPRVSADDGSWDADAAHAGLESNGDGHFRKPWAGPRVATILATVSSAGAPWPPSARATASTSYRRAWLRGAASTQEDVLINCKR